MKKAILIIAILVTIISCTDKPQYAPQGYAPAPNSPADTTKYNCPHEKYMGNETVDTIPIKLVYFDTASKKPVDEDAISVERYFPLKLIEGRISLENTLFNKQGQMLDTGTIKRPGKIYMGAQKLK